jgi:hypothetical protein
VRVAVVLALLGGGCSLVSSLDYLSAGGPIDAAAPDAPSSDAPSGDSGPRSSCPDGGPDPLGLLAFYPFEEGAGTRIEDCSGNGHHGNVIAGTQLPFPVGEHGSFSFELTVQNCIELEKPIAVDGPFTVAAWVYEIDYEIEAGTTDLRILASAGDQPLWAFGTGKAAVFEERFLDGDGGLFQVDTLAKQPRDVWLHVAAIYEPNVRAQIYERGVAATDASVPPALSVAGSIGRFGCLSVGRLGYRARIDDLVVYGRALSDGEIAALAH